MKQENFKTHLLEESEVLRRNGITLLEGFLEKGPFTAEWTAKEALSCLKDYRAQLRALREKEEQLRRDLALFGISLPESLELARLERVR